MKPGAFQRVKPARPGNKEGVQLATPDDGKMRKATTQYREEFREFRPIERPKSFKVINNYEPPKEGMEVESMYQFSYKGTEHCQ